MANLHRGLTITTLTFSRPNGCRETHALAFEVTQQPLIRVDEIADIEPADPIIPRVSKAEVYQTKLSEVSPIAIQHYEGQKRPLQPATDDHYGLPYHVVEERLNDISNVLQLMLNG